MWHAVPSMKSGLHDIPGDYLIFLCIYQRFYGLFGLAEFAILGWNEWIIS